MIDTLQYIHLCSFLGFFILFGIIEYIFPLRKKIGSTKNRWIHNITLSAINTIFVRVGLYITPVSFAIYLENIGFGFFNVFSIYVYLEFIISIVLLDLFIYIQHVYAHKWKWFWKLHSIHHSDITLDVSTAIRFHIGEIVLSIFFKMLLIVIFGFSAITIVIFETILVTSAMFNHANIKLPVKLDRYLNYVFVTPEFHQVHHSVKHKETDSNYGFFLSIWDRFFKTYTFHKFRVKKIGLSENKPHLSLRELLLLDINKK